MKTDVRYRINGKVNLCFDVGERVGALHRTDGICVPIATFDEVEWEPAERTTIEYSDGRSYERDNNARAIDLLGETLGIEIGARIRITKNIPDGAGLGGSAAVAGLIARIIGERVAECGLEPEALLGLGCDAPYFFIGGVARTRGFGERAERLELPEIYVAALAPRFGTDAGRCYALFDRVGGEGGDVDAFASELRAGRKPKTFNSLRRAATILEPRIEEGLRLAEESGLEPGMSGSGSAAFGYETDRGEFERKLAKLKKLAEGTEWRLV